MAQSFTPGLACIAHTHVRRQRSLPVPGKVLVRVGQSVHAETVVAEATLPGELSISRIAETLGIEPFEVVAGMKVRVGDVVTEGQPLCEHRGLFGLFKSTFPSPVSGTVELLLEHTGHVGVRLPSEALQLSAYLTGTVVAVEEERSVTIESEGAFVQGIFGVGGERWGIIHHLSVSPDHALIPADLPVDCKGKILVGGTAPSLEFLTMAATRGAVGLIVGSIDDRTIAGYLGYDLGIALTGNEAVPVTVMVTEGFGRMPLGARVDTLLRGTTGRIASMNGATQVRAGALRPEVHVSATGHSPLSLDIKRSESGDGGLTIGSSVRAIRVPFFGQLGTVIDLPQELREIPTGALVRTAVVRFESGEEAVIPRANLELQL